MARLILSEDIPIGISKNQKSGVEVGRLPKGVGMERLRWDGSKLVDMETISDFHVRSLPSGHFELHVVPVLGSQPITMLYRDRKRLKKQGSSLILESESIINSRKEREKAKQDLAFSDKQTARILEDLMELLVIKGTIQKTELPRVSQDKITHRENLRSKIRNNGL